MKKPKSKRFKAVQFRLKVVEVTGLEPTTFWSLTRRATKLRYTSIKLLLSLQILQSNNDNIIIILKII